MPSFKKFSYILLADIIFGIHLFLVLVVTFGWLTANFFYLFLGATVATILSDLILGSCILSVWEFGLRRKVDPTKTYDSSCITHYGRKLFGLKPREIDNNTKTFFQKNFFIFLLCVLLAVGSTFHYFMNLT